MSHLPRFVTVVLAALLALSWAPAVSAHSTLIDSCPFGGDVVNEIETIELTFGSPIVEDSDPAPFIELAGELDGQPGRNPMDIGPIVFDSPTELSVEILEPLDPGLYIVKYDLIAADGDDSDGGFDFTVDPDADVDSQCLGSSSGSSSWIVLAVAAVGLVGVAWLLRPRRKTAQPPRNREPQV